METLLKMADRRRQQAEKKGIADRYEPGTLVWIKTRPKSDKNKGLTKKLDRFMKDIK